MEVKDDIQYREPVYVVFFCANKLNKIYPTAPNKRNLIMFMTEV